MHATRFDQLARGLSHHSNRRTLLGVTIASLLSLPGQQVGAAKKNKKRKKAQEKCKKRGTCWTFKKGKCKRTPDDTACRGSGKCLKGRCNPLPICVQALEACPAASLPIACCSRDCTNSGEYQGCSFSSPGGLCIDSGDCGPGRVCIGYRCRET